MNKKCRNTGLGLFVVMILLTHCGQPDYKPSPDFELSFRVTNPMRSFKLNLGIKLHQDDSTRALLFIHRMEGPHSELDYHEPGMIRKNIADTILLSHDESEKIFKRVADVREQPFESESPSLQENFYRIHVTDKSISNDISAFESGDSPANELAEFLMNLFSARYPAVSLWSSMSELRLIKTNHGRVDSIKIWHSNKNIDYSVNGIKENLSENDFMRLWSVMEKNSVWKLSTDSTYRKFPLKYQIHIRMNKISNYWEVNAPYLLSDKRYFDIINTIETLNDSAIISIR